MSETNRSTAINYNCSLTANQPRKRITALETRQERVELGQGQFFVEKEKTYELWGVENGLKYRVRPFHKSSVLWVFEE